MSRERGFLFTVTDRDACLTVPLVTVLNLI